MQRIGQNDFQSLTGEPEQRPVSNLSSAVLFKLFKLSKVLVGTLAWRFLAAAFESLGAPDFRSVPLESWEGRPHYNMLCVSGVDMDSHSA